MVLGISLGIFSEAARKLFQFHQQMGDAIYNFFLLYSRPILDVLHFFFQNTFYALLSITVFITWLFAGIAIYTYFKKFPKEKRIEPKEWPRVTIQIPTYNELAALNCARRCLSFDYPKERFDIMIGDDSNDKSISAQIDAFAAKHPQVTVTRRGENIGFKPGNLNHMLPLTKGDYIVIFDSDFLPKQDFLKRIITPFLLDKNIAAVQSRWVMKNISQNITSLIGSIIPLISHHLGLIFLKSIKANNFIAGSGECVRKKDLIELGGWTAGAFTEDIDYSLRLTAAGKKIEYLEQLGCECESPYKMKDLSKQQMRWAFGVITATKKHFWKIMKNKDVPLRNTVNVFLLVSGYIVTSLFFLLALTGFLAIITNRPEPIIWSKFFLAFGKNMLVTSGFLFMNFILLFSAKQQKLSLKALIGSFSVGIVVVYYVVSGVTKAIFNRPMHWYMLAKRGNEVRL
ncbi:MAG: glycosyltransferase [Candidatus Woesearchaeota archaeon]|nr:MAG: glycosyltransferase [Candidatus Woesearchaeota archaeon]